MTTKKYEPESLPEDVAMAQLEREKRTARTTSLRPLFERTMMRCKRCSRWISVAPGASRACPGCAADGMTIIGQLEPVDMTKHVNSLPMRVDAPEDVKKFEATKKSAGK